jgi:hypothetical protein
MLLAWSATPKSLGRSDEYGGPDSMALAGRRNLGQGCVDLCSSARREWVQEGNDTVKVVVHGEEVFATERVCNADERG